MARLCSTRLVFYLQLYFSILEAEKLLHIIMDINCRYVTVMHMLFIEDFLWLPYVIGQAIYFHPLVSSGL